MPEREPTTEQLRTIALRALWRALGCDPAQTAAAVGFPKGVRDYLDVAKLLPESPEAQDVGTISLEEVAIEVRTIWSVSNDDQGAEYQVAFDLGDDFFYVAYTLTEIEHGTLQTAIPKRLAEEQFAKMRSGMHRAQLLTPDFGWQPTDVSGFDLARPESLRTIASNLDRPGFAEHVIEKMYGETGEGGEKDASVAENAERLQELWRTAVRCDPPRRRLPPGFALLVGRSQRFEKWLGRASVRWADTGERLDGKDSEALRLTCLFLAHGT